MGGSRLKYGLLNPSCKTVFSMLGRGGYSQASGETGPAMLINAVTYTFPVAEADEAERLFRELRAASLGEAGCLGYEVCRGDGDAAGTFVLYEKWRDKAALDEHYEQVHFVRLALNGLRPLATSRTAVRGTPVE